MDRKAARVRLYRCAARSLRIGHSTKTFRCTASAVPGALAAARPPLVAAAVLLRLVRTAATRAAAAPWRSRRCLLSMARALFAEASQRKLSPPEAHTLTGIRCEAHLLHLPQATVDEESYRQWHDEIMP